MAGDLPVVFDKHLPALICFTAIELQFKHFTVSTSSLTNLSFSAWQESFSHLNNLSFFIIIKSKAPFLTNNETFLNLAHVQHLYMPTFYFNFYVLRIH